jgi:Ca2+-binding RTX toxin-like protein
MATLIRSDLEFILQQIQIAEAHAAGADLATLVPNAFAPLGLRTVDGSYNNLVPGEGNTGAADQPFATMVDPNPRAPYSGATSVMDAQPRIISNLIADMTSSNPAAVQAFVAGGQGTIREYDGALLDLDGNVIPPGTLLTIPNVAPDAGLSAPFNSWFTFFGQFFDHGLDLVNKSATEFVMIPLQKDDPLYQPGSPTNFMVVSRVVKDANGNPTNATTPFVDQNQTYTSHPSHQVFLREYVLDAHGHPVATGNLLNGADGGLPTWADIKAQAHDVLGIALDDLDILSVPLVLTDPYGNFVPDPATGMPQLVMHAGPPPAVAVGNLAAPIDASAAERSGHAFLDDIAHTAAPRNSFGQALTPDADGEVGGTPAPGQYDDELLGRHFITGDGRGNENVALTAVHHVFHSEHNRQIESIKATVLATEDPDFISSWQLEDGSWDGERLFQAARFATEMQYQHLVFEEFARKLHPGINEFLAPEGYDVTIDPAIVGEFAHAMYRVGHTMLTNSVDRFDPDFDADHLTLLEAFLDPVAFNDDGALTADQAAGAIVRGMTRQSGNEIDEFVTDAVRNTLLGLPLDLAAINIARGRDTGLPTLNEARRQFHAMTGDGALEAYTSWVDLTQNLKHQASAINFIAAYGRHSELLKSDVDTVAEKRAVAVALAMGGSAVINAGTAQQRTFVADNADRLAFLNSTGDYANVGGKTITGVDDIDLWIGGLAEKQSPFGGMLGSTFGFIFETQLESLQNGDRFYYLSRTAGLHFGSELENNSFADLIMLNTDATHLPGDVFAAPGFTLEVDQNRQFTGLGDDGRDDPTGGTALLPLVIRDDPATAGPDQHYLRYTGADHVVLGGTDQADTLIASEGDDTIWGDGGNDRIEGGYGNDVIHGGAGDDIITDMGGDDVIHGEAGNDVIHAGTGLANIILGGDGNDFIITGDDIATTFGGQGNDFIYGAKLNLPTLGGEGDDWIEVGTQDGAGGDNFDPLGLGTILGNDVCITGNGFDEFEGEGGDDILVFSDGQDNFAGGGGFDWGSYAADPFGVTADLFINARVAVTPTPSNQGLMDRFAEVEGLSGSKHADYLRGDSDFVVHVAGSPAALDPTLIDVSLYQGLADILPAGAIRFNAGNIILGGDGSDLLEGRGDSDIIDGDRWLNVRISVRQNKDGTGPEIGSAKSMTELFPDMLSGAINPGQLQIVREIVTGDGSFNFDTAMFSGNMADYTLTFNDNGTALDLTDDFVTVVDSVDARDGTDTLRNVERLQFNDQAFVLAGNAGKNAGPAGLLTVSGTAQVNQVLTVSSLGVTDADNGIGSAASIANNPTTYFWQVERVPGSGVFEDIVTATLGNRESATGTSFTVTAALDGLALRVRAVYKDGHGVLENAYSAPTAVVSAAGPVAAPAPILAASDVATPGIHLIRSDLQFMLDQIIIAEKHSGAYGTPSQDLHTLIPNERLPWGLRTVDGSYNNLVPGQEHFGAADQPFPLLLDQVFRNDMDGDSFFGMSNGNYAALNPLPANAPSGAVRQGANVVDADPRIISNLISDQTYHNPAAVDANGGAAPIMSPGMDGLFGTADDRPVFFIPNSAPDAGLSAQFNAWFTFFGQFFDHGLDLVDKGPNAIFIPLENDDPLVAGADGIFGNGDDLAVQQRFMIVSRATNVAVQAGNDNVLGTADDVHFHNNETTPWVDQNQTYTSHASHQVFLREYELDGSGHAVATGRLLDGVNGGIGNWAEVKEQALQMLGLKLSNLDVLDVPLLATDAYGKFIPGAHGYAQVVTNVGLVEGTAEGLDVNHLGTTAGGVQITVARTGHVFLADIAHNAAPVSDTGQVLTADADDVINSGPLAAGTYDDELLDKHFITGDGRGNENIGLTSVHFIFHAEHNRLVEYLKDVVEASNDPAFISQWQMPDGSWNGERLFQAARFATEMQYQHLVFEEFARKVQPNIDVFLLEGQGLETPINPAIVAEFAHVVYRFGHSMLTETVDRFDPSFNLVEGGGDQQMGLIAAFLNPLAFTNSGEDDTDAASAIIRGLTRQPGNEIDEFVTEALRNNLLGLPLDLPAINIARGRDAGVPTLNQARAEFFAASGDSNVKPYSSWADFAGSLKHQASLVNFIAAYGTHSALTAADVNTVAERRAVALALVIGGDAVINAGTGAERTFTANEADRFAFLNSTGAYANAASGATTTGVDGIDLWIGGLAERQTPFGGLLGSTFNFVFEQQLEDLQNGDRFYYLERTANLNFNSELEGNSFARLIMANTNVKHLAALVFDTPAFTLEVDQSSQYTGLGSDGRADPTAPAGSTVPLVIRDNPDTAGPDVNYLHYTGADHVVLGGTSGKDILIGSEGDDTLYGDEGDDRLDGGAGNDQIRGGAGDDIITNLFGDDNLQGGDGNDAIHGGSGLELVIGGHGNDFIVAGNDATEVIAGPGNDFILAGKGNEFTFGNEGDDWIEHGTADGAAGENFDALGRDQVVGNDVFMGDGTLDRPDGEGGDDIIIGMGGQADRYTGFSGFDWASFWHPTQGTYADMTIRIANTSGLLPGSVATTQTRFMTIEGMSGSAFSDVLIGDEADATAIAVAGATGSVLTNFDLIEGLHAFVGMDKASFGSGNIILGGSGSDLIQGNGGDDLIDGDKWLDVYISVRAHKDGTGDEIKRAYSMTELVDDVFAGRINPGQLVIARKLVQGAADFDTAVFRGNLAEYTIETNLDGSITVAHSTDGGVTVGIDGVDRLTNIERLQFADFAVDFGGADSMPDGRPTIVGTPRTGQLLTASAAGVADFDNISGTNPDGAITRPISYIWQAETVPGSGIFDDIVLTTPAGDLVATGPTFRPGAAEAGAVLRVKILYQDDDGVLETAFSEPTAAVQNGDPTGALRISDTTPTEGQTLSAVNAFVDPDGTFNSLFSYQWLQSDAGGGGTFTAIAGATGATFTPGQDQVNRQLQVRVTYTDDAGGEQTLTSAPTVVTGDFIAANDAAEVLNGNAGQDLIFGGGGNDVINAGAENDTLDGGTGDDTINAGAGNDTINYTIGDGADTVDGGAGTGDRLNVRGTASANTLSVAISAGGLTVVAGNLLAGIESVVADMLGGTDTLSYAGNTESVSVDLDAGRASGFTSVAGIENVTGGSGDDLLAGSAGVVNILAGGAGNDTYVVHEASDAVVEGEDAGTDEVKSVGLAYTLSDNVENLTFTGSGDFTGTGNEQANVITGGRGADVLSGLGGNDTIIGGFGADTLNGGSGNDSLAGGAGNDRLAGGQGDDFLDGGAGVDQMAGGAGDDTYLVDVESDAITEVAGEGTDWVRSTAASYTLSADVENLELLGAAITGTGNGQGNLIAGNALDNVLAGLGGDDVILGNAGNDQMDGGEGNDYLDGGIGNDQMAGGEGNDFMAGADGDDQMAGDGGDDVLLADAGNDHMAGGAGNDYLDGGTGDDQMAGGEGSDFLVGGAGDDNMAGGKGDDTYLVDSAADVITEVSGEGLDWVRSTAASYTLSAHVENLVLLDGAIAGTGNDQANWIDGNGLDNILGGSGGDDIVLGEGGNDQLDGGSGNDYLDGGAGVDQLAGGEGVDFLDGGTGVDQMAGGQGGDTYLVDDAADTITEGLGQGLDWVRSTAASYTLSANVENLELLGAAITGIGNGLENRIAGNALDNVLTGNGGDDLLLADAGNDQVDGGEGNDYLDGGAGNDHLAGGEGNDFLDGGTGVDEMAGGEGGDTYLVDDAADAITEGLGQGLDWVRSTAASYTLSADVENLELLGAAISGTGNELGNRIAGNALDNVLTGNGGDDLLLADAGNDQVDGGQGNDYLDGGAGNDQLAGGEGNDFLDGGTGVDDMAGGEGDDTYVVDSAADVITETTGPGVDWVRSTAASYTLSADVENLQLLGAGADATGNDQANWIFGNALDNVLRGQGGDDVLVGGGGNDILVGGNGADALGGDDGEDVLNGGNGDDHLDGGAGNDALSGGAGNDVLVGGDGNDLVNGGAGDDILTGGAGADIFVFQASFGHDQVFDFDAEPAGGQDRIDLTALGVTFDDFDAAVVITADGADTLVTIGDDSFTLFGVTGTGANVITQTDFILA